MVKKKKGRSLYNDQKDITIINIYAFNIRAPKYIKQILTDLKRSEERNRQ